jgi:hypothetical protein
LRSTKFVSFSLLFISSLVHGFDLKTPATIDLANAAPFEINFEPHETVDTTLTVSSDISRYLSINFGSATEALVTSVMSRAWVNSNTMVFEVRDKTGGQYDFAEVKFSLNGVPDKVRPVTLPIIMRKFGKRELRFSDHGTRYVVGSADPPGRFSLLIGNSGSQSGHLEEVILEAKRGAISQQIKIAGTPHWFEPIIVITGRFDQIKVLSVKARSK